MADTVRIELAVEAVDNTGKVIDNIVNSLQKLKTAAGSSKDSLGKASDTVSKFDTQAQKTQKTLQGWLKQKWQIALEAKDRITPLLSTLKSGLSTLAGTAWNVTLKAFDFVTAPVRGILDLLKNPILQAGAVLGVTIGVKDTIDTYKDFEATMSKVKAISGATTSEMERLTAKAQEMGETTKFTATEAGEAFSYMAMAGWDSQQMLNGIGGIMNLAAADGLDLATTSDIVTDALTAFHLKASDAAHFADVLAKASSSANTNVAMLGSSFKYVGSVAGAFGYSIEDTAIALATMANAGVKGDMGGTALRGALTSLVSPSENAAAVMEKYGLSMEGANGQAKTLMEVMEMLRSKFNGLNVSLFDGEGELKDYETILAEASQAAGDTSASVETLSDLSTLFSARALPGMLALIQSGTEDFYKLSDAIYHADGTASDMSETMMDNLAGSLKLLQSAAEGAKLSVGSRLAPYVRQFAEWLTNRMPAIKQGLNEGIDWIEGKIDELKNKIQSVTGSVQFQDTDFFGKVEILWDEIIANPLNDWWQNKGHRMFAEKAGDAAQWIGEGIRHGLLALLGIQMDAKEDRDTAKDAGVSIAASFMNGLKEGLNSGGGIGSIVSAIFGNLVSSAGKILPGGAAPGLDTLVSAVVLSKIASPVLAAGKGVSTLGKAVMTPTASGGASLGASLIGSAAAGTGLLGLGSNTAIALGAGNLAGGASLGVGALSALGLGTIAGGALGVISAGTGFYDWNKASRTEDEQEKEMLQTSGNWKVGGVAGGAAAGAAIGSFIPVIGTAAGALIGAGIGGAVGMYQGSKRKKEYEEQAQAAQEAAAKEAEAHELITAKAAYTGQSIQEITFKSKELNEAFRDSSTSAESFYTMFREAVNEKVTSSFGSITLSLQEIRDMADSIVFDGAADSAEAFQNAIAQAQKELASAKTDLTAVEKLNWKASLGFDFTDADLSDYQAQVDAFARDAQNYVTDSHYEAALALKLLTNGEGDTSGLDSAYAAISEELTARSAELQTKVQAALEDGVISTDPVTLPDGSIQLSELAEITNLQNQISDIMNRVSAAEESARLETLQIKYGGSNLDAASFRQLQAELASSVEEMTASYTDALEISLTNLHLQFPDGGEAFEEAKAQLTEEFNQRMSEMTLRVEGFQLDTIASSFSADFDAVWPELSGSVDEMSARLKAAMETALAVEPDPVQWTAEQMTGWFGLSGMDTEAQAAITEMLAGVAQTIPEAVRAQFADINLAGEVAEAASEAMAGVEDIDVSNVLDAIPENAAEAARNLDMSEASDAVGTQLMDAVNTGLTNVDGAEIELSALKDAAETGVTDTLSAVDVQAGVDALNETLGGIDVTEGAVTLATNTQTAVSDAMTALDLSGANEALTAVIGGGFTEAVGGVDFTEGTGILTTNVTASVTDGMNGLDFSAASEAVRAILSAAIAAGVSGTDLSAAFAALTALRQRLEAQAKTTLGAQMSIQVPVSLTYNYSVTNPTPPKPTVTAQTVSASVNVGARGNGGITSGAELSWVGEDGPEAIIPLGMKRRERGLELYRQVGEILGVAKNAEGGVYGGPVYNNTVYSGPVNAGRAYTENQFTDTTLSFPAPDGLRVSQYPGAETVPSYNTRNSLTEVRNTRSGAVSSYSVGDTLTSASSATTYDTLSSAANSYSRIDERANTNIMDIRTAVSDVFHSVRSTISESGAAYDNRRTYGGSNYRAEYTAPLSGSSAVYDMSRSAASSLYQTETNRETTSNTLNTLTEIRNSLASLPTEITTAYNAENSSLSLFSSNTSSLSRNVLNSPTDIRSDTRTAEARYMDMRRESDGSAYSVDSVFRLPEEKAVTEALDGPDGTSERGAGWGDTEKGGRGGETGFLPITDGLSGITASESGMPDAGRNVPPINVNVSITPQFSFGDMGGKSESELEAFIRRCLMDSMDDFSAEFADRLSAVFANMPRG